MPSLIRNKTIITSKTTRIRTIPRTQPTMAASAFVLSAANAPMVITTKDTTQSTVTSEPFLSQFVTLP